MGGRAQISAPTAADHRVGPPAWKRVSAAEPTRRRHARQAPVDTNATPPAGTPPADHDEHATEPSSGPPPGEVPEAGAFDLPDQGVVDLPDQGPRDVDEGGVVDVPEPDPVVDDPDTEVIDVTESDLGDVPEPGIEVPESEPVDVPEPAAPEERATAPTTEAEPTAAEPAALPAEGAPAEQAPSTAEHAPDETPAEQAPSTAEHAPAETPAEQAPSPAEHTPVAPAGTTTPPPPPPGPRAGVRPPPPPARPGNAPGRYSAAPWAPGTAPQAASPPARSPGAAEEAGYQSGQLVSGRIVSVDEQEVVVDLGDGRTGVISKRHFSPDGKADPSATVAADEEIEAAVLVREDRLNRVVLSRTWAAKQRAWQRIDEALTAREPVSGPVTEVVKGGVVVDIGIRAFLPASQLELRHVDDLHAYVGQTVEALVTEADKSADKVVLSRRSLLRRHEKQRVSELLGDLQPGQLRRGRVATITDFGAFVDLGGLRGLLHLSELSWDRVERTTDVVNVGDEIEVKILSIKDGTKKISLSLRAVSPDPLREVVEGEVVQGIVSRLVDFGAFVRIKNGVEGLVHVSELAEHRIHLPEEVVTPGDEVYVKVLRVDRRRRRLDLSINQAVQF
ncbi:MAG: S1 RNA-binding domain-containing protein [Acidimicrobiia bacterium]|nr:S1 RNA-binding domain-containing protein [Acidimicrobiia bacterium]